MRAWFSGKTSAFQAEDAGSIPAARFQNILFFVPNTFSEIINTELWFFISIDSSSIREGSKIFVIPLGGKDSDIVIEKLKEFSFVIRKVLSKKIMIKFLPKLFFVNDDSFDYAEKIENLIRQTQK